MSKCGREAHKKGSVTEVVCRQASSKYCQAPEKLTDPQEEVEEIVDELQEIGSVLAGIEEASCCKQRPRHKGVRQNELRNSMAEVDGQLFVTSQGEEFDSQFNYTKARLKQMEEVIVEAVNERNIHPVIFVREGRRGA